MFSKVNEGREGQRVCFGVCQFFGSDRLVRNLFKLRLFFVFFWAMENFFVFQLHKFEIEGVVELELKEFYSFERIWIKIIIRSDGKWVVLQKLSEQILLKRLFLSDIKIEGA